MTTTRKSKHAIAMIGLLAGLTLAGATAYAQTNAPASAGNQGDDTMDRQMPMGNNGTTPGMMMNGEMQEKMSRMMDNCNRMMESMMQNRDRAPEKKG
jgi:hypothetical protein